MKWANIDANTFGIHANTDPDNVVSLNWGDHIQIFAIDNLYRYMGIPSSSIVKISYYDLQTYTGEPIILPVNLVVNLIPSASGALFSENIYPVFLGACFPYGISKETAQWLKQWEPIGCRDEGSYYMLQEFGIDSYLAGCLTISLPERTRIPEKHKIFMIDAPEKMSSFVPARLLESVSARSNVYQGKLSRLGCSQVEYAESLYEQLSQEATAVITSRLHVTAPCLAMGIPVYCCVSKVTAAFTWLQNFTTIYTPDKYSTINWSALHKSNVPQSVKQSVLELSKERMLSAYYRFNSLDKQLNLTSQYLHSSCSDYISLRSAVEKIILELIETYSSESRFCYTLWGIVPQAQIVCREIQNNMRNAKLVGVYDTYKSGDFLGLNIEHPDNIRMCDDDVFHIVCAEGACCDAKQLFKRLGISSTRFLLITEKIREVCFSERKNNENE